MKRELATIKKIIILIVMALLLVGCRDTNDAQDPVPTDDTAGELTEQENTEQNASENEEEELTSAEKINNKLSELADDGRLFDVGSYIPGDIPEGEYVFSTFEGSGEYYAEKELNGDIIDNENFNNFGYVYVHGTGNIETKGMLISVDDLDEIGATGAKEIYEVLNDVNDHNGSGLYKVGEDIEAGEYVIEGDESYVAVMSGPVGNDAIINNEIISGRYAVVVEEGQYLKILGGTITEE